MKTTLIFTDGSSRGNPGPGGWGAIVIGETDVQELGGRVEQTTNNRMELSAVIYALEYVKVASGSRASVKVLTDSSYVLKGATEWLSGWQRNQWKTAAKQEVLNRDLWEVFLLASEGVRITWQLLKGHAGIPANERCDEIATAFADNKAPVLFSGPLDTYPVDFSLSGTFIPRAMKSRSKNGKAYSYVSRVDGVIQTHTTWKECEARVKGVPGARFKRADSAEDERTIIAEWKKL